MQRKKVPFSQIDISILADIGCYFLEQKRIFGPFSAFRQNVKRPFLRKSGQDQVRCQCKSFFGGPDGLTKFCWPQSKIKGTIGEWPKIAKIFREGSSYQIG